MSLSIANAIAIGKRKGGGDSPIPPYPPKPKYVSVFAVADSTIAYKSSSVTSMEYSSNGINWQPLTSSVGIAKDTEVLLRGWVNGNVPIDDYAHITLSGNVRISGDLMALYDGSASTDVIEYDHAFYGLFRNNNIQIDASGLYFSARILSESCYSSIFHSCGLTKMPRLRGDVFVPRYGYYCAFIYNKNLTEAYIPNFTFGANDCAFKWMIGGCSKLKLIDCGIKKMPRDINFKDENNPFFQWCFEPATNGVFRSEPSFSSSYVEDSSTPYIWLFPNYAGRLWTYEQYTSDINDYTPINAASIVGGFVDTHIFGGYYKRFDIDFKVAKTTDIAFAYTCYNGSSWNNFIGQFTAIAPISSSSKNAISYCYPNSKAVYSASAEFLAFDGNRHTYSFIPYQNKKIVDGVEDSNVCVQSANAKETIKSLSIGSRSAIRNMFDTVSSIVIYHTKVTDNNGNVLQELVPMKHKKTGEVGLFDIVNNWFLTDTIGEIEEYNE